MLPGDAEAHASTSADIAAARPPIITVMHASVGSGHKAAANAVAQAIDRLRGTHGIPNNVIVDVIDILDYGRIKFDGNKTAAAFTAPRAPSMTSPALHANRSLPLGRWHRMVARHVPCLQRVYREQAAIAVIATHITAANVAVGARMITGIDYPLVCIPTDYEIEGWWPHKETDLFCVATEFMAETLRPRKVEESRITITGIPVRAGFDKPVIVMRTAHASVCRSISVSSSSWRERASRSPT